MWKTSAVVAIVEVLAYLLFGIVTMVRTGQGSGTVIILLPFAWAVFALRSWALLRIAAVFFELQPRWPFVLLVAALSYFGTLFLLAYLGIGTNRWSDLGALPFMGLAPVVAALFITRVGSTVAAESGLEHETQS